MASSEEINSRSKTRAYDRANGRDRSHKTALSGLRDLEFLHDDIMCGQLLGVTVYFALEPAKIATHVDKYVVNIRVGNFVAHTGLTAVYCIKPAFPFWYWKPVGLMLPGTTQP